MTIQAEQALTWFFNDAEARLSISAVDHEALANSPRKTPASGSYSDSILATAERTIPIRAALGQCSRRQRKVLRLAFTERCWKGQEWFDYFRPYGARLAAIVLEYKPAVSPGGWADIELSKALRRFSEVYNVDRN